MPVPTAQDRRADEHAFATTRPVCTEATFPRGGPLWHARNRGGGTVKQRFSRLMMMTSVGFDPPPFVDSPSARPLGIKSTIRWADRIAAAQFLLTRAFFLRRFSSFADISAREEDALKRAIFLSIGNDGIVKTRLLDRNLEMLYSYVLHRERCIKWFGMGINWDHFKDFRDHRTILETFNGGD